MKNIKKLSIFLAICLMLSMLLSVCALAASTAEDTERLGDKDGSKLTIMQRVEYALQGTVTGMIMIFAVLALLAIVVSLSKVVLYDIPKKAREAALKEQKEQEEAENAPAVQESVAPVPVAAVPTEDEGQLIAVITAAVAAAIEGGEYKDQFASGFRVVSFTRVNGAWDKK